MKVNNRKQEKMFPMTMTESRIRYAAMPFE